MGRTAMPPPKSTPQALRRGRRGGGGTGQEKWSGKGWLGWEAIRFNKDQIWVSNPIVANNQGDYTS